MFVYRDEVYDPQTMDKGTAEIIIGKQRNGPVDTVKVRYQADITCFEDFPSGAYSLVTGGLLNEKQQYEGGVTETGRELAAVVGNVAVLPVAEMPMVLMLEQLRPNPDNPRTTRQSQIRRDQVIYPCPWSGFGSESDQNP